MKRKIVLLPLDERPCNYNFPAKLFEDDQTEIMRPQRLGDKKKSANTEELFAFLKKECSDADGLVLSMDMLLYGGLISSRIHHLDETIVEARLQLVQELKKINPKLTVFAFQCIMRCPAYSSSDEEPDYYEYCGKEIHKSGDIKHRYSLGLCDASAMGNLYNNIPQQDLDDYLGRRAFNLRFNQKTLELVQSKVIDFLVIPQDDSARYGYTAMDQAIVRGEIGAKMLQNRVLMYPGADEVGMTLMSRMALNFANKRPNVFVKYAASYAPFVIPAYEDRTLGETVKYHLLAAGCRCVYSEAEADFVLAINSPAGEMKEAVTQPVQNQDYCVERNLTEFVQYLWDCIHKGKPISVCDNAYANGSDLELIAMMNQADILTSVAGYAGWNTSSNTMGTAVAMGARYVLNGADKAHLNFLCLRYFEDAGYCSVVRKYITEHLLEELNMDYFNVVDKQGVVSELVKKYLEKFAQEYLTTLCGHFSIQSVSLPWRRMFEVDLEICYCA